MYPLFFSVASPDITFAESVWEGFPDDLVYLYSRTGQEGADMWDEISRDELPNSKLLVIFWSINYPKAQGCVREILQAKDLVQRGLLRPIVLRLDDYPITWREDLGEEAKPTFDALRLMLSHRTSAPSLPAQKAIEIVQRIAEASIATDHPRLPRPELQQALRNVVRRNQDRFTTYPAVWLSGFNGVGRETLARDFNRNFVPNGRACLVQINEASLPKQIRLRLESEAFGTAPERLRELSAEPDNTQTQSLVDTIERVYTSGNYVAFRHSRIVEETVELPDWLTEVINALTPSTRPKLFIISQLPLLAERRNLCTETLVTQRVPTINDDQFQGFCCQLIAHFDANPNRWPDVEIDKLMRAARGNIGFLVSLVRAASTIDDFDEIDSLVDTRSNSLIDSVTAYVRWAFTQLRDLEDEQRALLFLNDVSPCDRSDLEAVLQPTKRPMHRIVGKLLGLGLIEREGDSLYKLTPLLSNRLSKDLIRTDLLSWERRALMQFVERPLDFDVDGNDYIRIESRIQASLLAETDEIPKNLIGFVSAAHWFQAGVRLYHAKRREPAYRLLKKAFENRAEFTNDSRVELARYYCLSATRNRRHKEAESCINLLDSAFQTKGMAAFLRADSLEHRRRFAEAIPEYELSLNLNKGKLGRLERTYRPLITCILRSANPDYPKAERYAKEALKIGKTLFSLLAMARVYLHWKHKAASLGRSVPSDIEQRYRNAVLELENDAGKGSAHFELKAEEAEFTGQFDDAVRYMDQAIEADPRFELRAERWRLMAKSSRPEIVEKVLKELDAARSNPDYRGNWVPFLPALAETYAIALRATSRRMSEINSFAPELIGDELGVIVSRVNRT